MERSGAPQLSDIEQAVVEHYERRLAQHGPNAQGMDWKDEDSQRLRFEILCGVCNLEGLELCEIGCGAGHLLDYLTDREVGVTYRGIDLSTAMIAAARERYPEGSFERLDILSETLPPADVVVCSGAFHVKLAASNDAWRDYLERCLQQMFEASRVALAFNLMSDQVDYKDEGLYYANPSEILNFCRRVLGRRVALRHDYPLYEFTTYVYRDDTR